MSSSQPTAFTNAFKSIRGLLYSGIVFGAVANLLLLTSPMFMLLVYDRVLSSRSVETLVSLLTVSYTHLTLPTIYSV